MTRTDPSPSGAVPDDPSRPRSPSPSDLAMDSRPSLEAILRPFPSTRARGRWPDRLLYHALAAGQAALSPFPGRGDRRTHPRLLAAAVQEVLRCYRDPVCLETGCVGSADDETESTVTLASVLRGQGRLLCLEDDEERIAACRTVCGSLNQWIEYVEGQPARSIRRLREQRALGRVHLAFLHSSDDPGPARSEFDELEDLVVDGGLVVVDRAIRTSREAPGVRRRLAGEPGWDARVVNAAPGILVAQRRGSA